MLINCFKIFVARIVDVSLGTIRTVFFVKGKTIEPFIIAFFEVIIWYLVAKEALNTKDNTLLIGVSYALGYATGTYIGSKLSNKLIKGFIGVQIISNKSESIIKELRNNGYKVSVIELKNTYKGDNKEMIYIQLRSDTLNKLRNVIKKYDREAFIVVNDTKLIQNGLIK